MGFVNFLTYIKHLGEKALVFFPSKTDLITITDKNGEVTEELLSERLEAINNKIEKQNLLKNVAQYTKENPLVYTFNKNFSTTCTLEAGKQYSLSFDYAGELSRNNEIGFTNIDDSDNADIIDIINQSTIYDFYFQAKFSAEYNFYWNMLDENNKNTKIYNLKVVEGYSPEMVRTVEEIKKLDKSKLENVENTADKDKFVAGLIDANDPYGTRHIFANWAGNSELAISNIQYFTTLSAKNKDSEIRPLSVAKTKTVLGVDAKQNITNGIVTTDTDWNTLTTAGAYKIQNCNMTEANHAPVGEFAYGSLFVIVSELSNEKRTIQLYFPSNDTNNMIPGHKFSIRAYNKTSGVDIWSGWHKFLTEDNGVKKSGDTMTGTLTAPLLSGPIQGKKGGASIFLNDAVPLNVEEIPPEGVCVWYAIGGNKYDIQRITADETKTFLGLNDLEDKLKTWEEEKAKEVPISIDLPNASSDIKSFLKYLGTIDSTMVNCSGSSSFAYITENTYRRSGIFYVPSSFTISTPVISGRGGQVTVNFKKGYYNYNSNGGGTLATVTSNGGASGLPEYIGESLTLKLCC